MLFKTYRQNERVKFFNMEGTYTGQMKKFKDKWLPHGNGVITLDNRDKFNGKFNKGRPIHGHFTWINGSYSDINFSYSPLKRYVYADFSNYGFRGYSIQKKDTSEGLYEGEIINGRFEGIGKYSFWLTSDTYKQSYVGGWMNNVKHGIGYFSDYYCSHKEWVIHHNGKLIQKLTEREKYLEESEVPDTDDTSDDSDYEYISDVYRETESSDEEDSSNNPAQEHLNAAVEAYNSGHIKEALAEISSAQIYDCSDAGVYDGEHFQSVDEFKEDCKNALEEEESYYND